ncbi:MAG: hypothetical protein ACRDNZ_23070, partial [Streptosporangiaceae bacterium]
MSRIFGGEHGDDKPRNSRSHARHPATLMLTGEDVAALEVLLLDELAAWIRSDANPGEGYSDRHGQAVAEALLSAVSRAPAFRPAQAFEPSADITAAREQVAAGARALTFESGPATLTEQLMPVALRELGRNAGDPGAQICWLYYHALLALAAAADLEDPDAVMRGITATCTAWGELLQDGAVLPWRCSPKPPAAAPVPERVELAVSEDLVTAYVETLIERLTGADKAVPDHDGDYPVQYRSALYYIRVVGGRVPVVQVFS